MPSDMPQRILSHAPSDAAGLGDQTLLSDASRVEGKISQELVIPSGGGICSRLDLLPSAGAEMLS
jgi:hypothetical protein